jgi:Uma2 family endonuclease
MFARRFAMPPVALSPPPAEKRLMTADEFWDFVHREENRERELELIRGRVIEGIPMRPNLVHGSIMTRIAAILMLWSDRRGMGLVVCGDAGVVLSEDTVVGPDIAYYTHVHLLDELSEKWSTVPPHLAVEILSPSNRPAEVNRKIFEYLTAGTAVVWLVDPEQKQVTVFRPGSGPQVCRSDETIEGGSELPGFLCRVADFFRASPRPQP